MRLQIGRFAFAFFFGLAGGITLLAWGLQDLGLLTLAESITISAISFALAAMFLAVIAMLRRRLAALERDVRNDVVVQNHEVLQRIDALGRSLAELRVQLERQTFDPAQYWRDRAQHYGKLAVGDIGHVAQIEADAEVDKRNLLPFLKTKLRGDEARALDFGCGFGRFTHELAALTGGEVVGVDITPELLEIAEREKKNPKITFARATGTLPFPDEHFDLIWVSYVFIHIIGEDKEKTAKELTRVLKKGGLLFMTEGVTLWRTGAAHCEFRPLGWYQQAFPFELDAYTRDDLKPTTVEQLIPIEAEAKKTNRDLHIVMTGRKT